MLVPEDPAIPADMRTDGDEAGVAVDADAVGLEVLDLDPLAVLRQDGDFNCCFRSIWGFCGMLDLDMANNAGARYPALLSL